MIFRSWQAAVWSGLWLLLAAVALTTRPLLPVDETRYLAVAWEMWRDGEFLVPHLNGQPYSHKPPLFFWLINLGWTVFGLNEWWPRLVAPLFGLGSLFLTAALARALWPGARAVALAAPLILVGGGFWTVFTTLTMFDMILAFCTLVGLLGAVRAWRTGHWTGFALVALGIGLGGLTKGPAILPHLLPAALLAPLWGRALEGAEASPPGGWGRWYGGLAAALAAGVAVVLGWAVPAGTAGGEAYREAIFWGQSAGRMVESFAHGKPWWWFLAVLPPTVLPWLIWPQMWRAARGLGRGLADGGIRFALCWFLPSFLAFSLISGKQIHYMLPVFPALALAMAWLLTGGAGEVAGRRFDQVPPGLFAAVLGGAGAAVLWLAWPLELPPVAATMEPGWALLALGAGVAVAATPVAATMGRLAALSALSAATVTALHLVVRPLLAEAYDLAPLAVRLGEWERQGFAIAQYGKYHGQFHFAGRLTEPISVVGLTDYDMPDWLARFPAGKVVSYYGAYPEGARPDYVQRFRRGYVIVWDRSVALNDPGVLSRDGVSKNAP